LIPFPPWEPDKGPYSGVSTNYVRNAIPASNGWRPFKTWTAATQALAERPTGVIYAKNSEGISYVIAGTLSAIYRSVSNVGLTSWTDISAAGGYTQAEWQFTQFGSKIIGVSGLDAPQVWDVEVGGDFDDLGGTPPKALYIASVGDFVVLANTEDGTRRIQWSGQNNEGFWTVGQQSADYQVLPDGDDITGIIAVPGGARVFQQNAIRTMLFAPSSGFVFTFDILTRERGAVAPNAIINIGRGDYVFLAEDGFYRGDQGQPIGAEKVNRFFLDDVDQDDIANVRGAADFQNKTAWWNYRTNTGAFRIIGYNWQLDRWTLLDLSESYFIVNGVTSTFAPSIDSIDETFGNLEDLDDVSLDELSYSGGILTFSGFNSNYEFGTFSGDPVTATLRTQHVELSPGRRSFVRGFRLVGDVNTTFSGRVYTQAYASGPSSTGTPATSSSVTGLCPLRSDARYHAFEVEVGTGFELAHGIDPEYSPAGQR